MPRLRIALHVTAGLTLAALGGCASHAPTPATAPSGAPAAAVAKADSATTPATPALLRGSTNAGRRRDQQLLTREDILATQYTNLYDVVRALRGNWLRIRSADSFEKSQVLQVYLDNQRLAGGADELKLMAPTNIESIRYLDPVQASSRWGLDHGMGAILVTTSKR